MLRLAIVFLVVALLASILGFPMIVGFTYDAAKLLFFIFLVLAVLFFIGNLFRGSAPRDIV